MNSISFHFDPAVSTHNTIARIIDAARVAGRVDAIAYHLVGATLTMRFPTLEIHNACFTAGDVQTGREGDFQLGDMPLHVTMRPLPAVFDRFQRNVQEALGPLLLVPDQHLPTARGWADLMGLTSLAVESIESFVALNCDELAQGSRELQPGQLRQLITLYNQRVDAVETDKSLLIELPTLLADNEN